MSKETMDDTKRITLIQNKITSLEQSEASLSYKYYSLIGFIEGLTGAKPIQLKGS